MIRRPFTLTVDSGHRSEPEPRTYSTLALALDGYDALAPLWQRFAWITEQGTTETIVHMADGRRTTLAEV